MTVSKLYRSIGTFTLAIISFTLFAQNNIYTDVLVIGGGTGGTAAGLQSGRMGTNTIIAEPTSWLGGMLSSAGVSAIDGNHNLPSGIWAEFREQLYKVYGNPDKVSTGWVSNTLFEPHVGDSILKVMAATVPKLKILYHYRFLKVIRINSQIKGAIFYNEAIKSNFTIFAKQIIDGTEMGDVMASAKIPYDVGMEASDIIREKMNVHESNNIVQDLTYAAILKDYGPNADSTIVKPTNYTPLEFDGSCSNYYKDTRRNAPKIDANKMLDYGKLPNHKYMLNWPAYGNDIYLNIINLSDSDRKVQLVKAKEQTKRFIYFIQTQLGYRNLGLADDEFPTADRLPLIAYYREGRRVKGEVRFLIQHITNPFNDQNPLYRTGIAVGDYPIDQHHRKNPMAPQHLIFPPIPSFNIPLGALIPKNFEGIIIAEKGISVSNVVNGTTRLQPCVLLTGQAAGVLAALCIKQKKSASKIDVRDVQEALLNYNAYIMPYYDVKPTSAHFIAVQKIGASGILKGTGQPNAWANRTWFYPDSLVKTKQLIKDINPFVSLKKVDYPNRYLSIYDAIQIFRLAAESKPANYKKNNWDFTSQKKLENQLESLWTIWGLNNFDLKRDITRMEFAVILDKTINPFRLKKVDHLGYFKFAK